MEGKGADVAVMGAEWTGALWAALRGGRGQGWLKGWFWLSKLRWGRRRRKQRRKRKGRAKEMFLVLLNALEMVPPLLVISAKHSLSVGNKAKQNRTPQSQIKVGMDSTNWNNRCQESLVLRL